MVRTIAPAVFALALVAAMLPAHGGQYRGPFAPNLGPGMPLPPNGPPTGGPARPAGTPPGVNTGARAAANTVADWQVWWELNKAPFLQLRAAVHETPVSGSDDFYLGERRAGGRVDTLAPTEVDLRDRLVPAIAKLLASERNRDVQSACLIGLGKIGRDGEGVALETTLAAAIARDDQEVRESAVLALGIAGRAASLPLLAALLRDDAAGRKLAAKDQVSDRTRAFAAYGLGLLARRAPELATKQQVHDLLWPVLVAKDSSRDLRTAAVNGLGLLGCDPAVPGHRRLLWQAVEGLLEWCQRDLGRGDEILQAQAPVAITRLLGRGDSPLHQRCKALFGGILTGKPRRHLTMVQSSALALGGLCLPEERCAEDAPFALALRNCYADGNDLQARWYAVIALGRIGGAANRAWLLAAYPRSNKGLERPWVAMALGVLAHAHTTTGATDAQVAELLFDDFQSLSIRDTRAAVAIALGLTGHQAAVPTLQKLLVEHENDEQFAGHLAVALALLGDRGAAPTLLDVLERSLRRPFLVTQCAVALGRLGDKNAVLRLHTLLAKAEGVAVLSALALGIGQVGDRRSIEPLIAMSQDTELTKLARAFVAAALGGVGDKDRLPWNTPLCVDSNYYDPVDTLSNGQTGVLDIL